MHQVQEISLCCDKLIPCAILIPSGQEGQAVVDLEHAVLEEGGPARHLHLIGDDPAQGVGVKELHRGQEIIITSTTAKHLEEIEKVFSRN